MMRREENIACGKVIKCANALAIKKNVKTSIQNQMQIGK